MKLDEDTSDGAWPEGRSVDPDGDQDLRAAVLRKLGESEPSLQQQPVLDDDLGSIDEGEDFASACASAPSLPRPSLQGAKGGTKSRRIQRRVHQGSALVPGRTPIPTRPFILRSIPKQTTTPLTQDQTTQLLRSLTQRDRCILQSLYDYRYLTTLQIRHLFFPSIRSAQLRLQYLRHHGLVYRWKMFESPGVTRRPSLVLITPRGAHLLADLHGESPWPYVHRAKDARDHCWHVVHDLEANGFFIDLVLASRLGLREGLLRWVGEETCRADRRLFAREQRRPVATPDGAGWYLAGGGIIRFDLEWDRGTASMSRLRHKVRTLVRYFKDTRDAERYHVLFVLSRPSREETLRPIIQNEFPGDSCRFWTSTVERLEAAGPLGRLWCAAEKTEAEDAWPPPLRTEAATLPRRRLTELPPYEKSGRTINDCIGKPGWWERRPGGGEVL
ncbi:MAG TPA: replication-relaxation family protein [Candidatus Dormibacteraeota bacterium]|nr:replication-relaxation family protein [Candidatus Dormibacteraeota bacterium]